MLLTANTSKARRRRLSLARQYWALYLLLIIPVAYLLIYKYYPILTQFVLSFKNYTLSKGIWNSDWVGWNNYRQLFASREFSRIIVNTVRISVLNLFGGFLPPIILSIMLFDLRSNRFRRISQSILYIPHFFSWIVVYNVIYNIFCASGYINSLRNSMGLTSVNFLMDVKYFLPMLIGSGIWKELGWGTIIYLAALTSIDTELFDVAKIDGAGPLQRVWYVTLPGILPVVVFMITLSLGKIMSSANTEQILLFYGPVNYSVSDVIGTWVYRQGLGKLQYSLGAAVSMFQSVIGLVLVLTFNKLANKVAGVGIW